jgi:hypothetical protein
MRRLGYSLGASMAAMAMDPATSQIYLHNERDAAAISKARDSLTDSRTKFVAAFEDNSRVLAELMANERRAAFASQLAMRDYELADVVHRSAGRLPKGERSARDTLTGYVAGRRQAVADGYKALPAKQAERLHHILRAVAEERDDIYRAIAQRDAFMTQFRQQGGTRGRPCGDDGTGAIPPPADTPDKAMALFRIASGHCEVIVQRLQTVKTFYRNLPVPLTLAFGAAPDPSTLPKGELREAATEQRTVAQLVKTQEQLAKSAREYLERSEKYLACVQKQASSPGVQAQINGAAKRLADFLKWLDEDLDKELDGEKAPESADPKEELKPCTHPDGASIEAPPPVSSVDELDASTAPADAGDTTADRLRLDDVKLLVKAGSNFEPTRAIVAAVQEEVQDFREGVAGKILTGLVSPDLNDPKQREATIASNVLRILQAAQNLQPERRPNVSGILIDIAAARLRSETARIEAERLKQVAQLTDMKVLALAQELVLLARAEAELSRTDDASLDKALRQYGQSWTEFRAPQTVIKVDLENLEYTSWSNRERATAEATFAMLEPALNELNEYGQGGLTSGDIARILSTIGIGALNVED